MRYWTERETMFLKENYGKLPLKDVGLVLNRSHRAIKAKSSKLKLKVILKKTRIETLSDVEKAYLAGFIDGEGSISLKLYSRKDKPNKLFVNAIFTVTNADKGVMSFVAHVFNREVRPEQRKNWKTAWRVQVSKLDHVREILNHLLPYLKVKRKQAELLLEFCNYRLAKLHQVYKAPFDDYEKILIREVQRTNQLLNSQAKVQEAKLQEA
jgi:hypothetical protein